MEGADHCGVMKRSVPLWLLLFAACSADGGNVSHDEAGAGTKPGTGATGATTGWAGSGTTAALSGATPTPIVATASGGSGGTPAAESCDVSGTAKPEGCPRPKSDTAGCSAG